MAAWVAAATEVETGVGATAVIVEIIGRLVCHIEDLGAKHLRRQGQ